MQCGTAVGWDVAGTDLHVQLYRLYTAQEEALPEIHPTLHYQLRALAWTAVCSSTGKGGTRVPGRHPLLFHRVAETPSSVAEEEKGKKIQGSQAMRP